MAALRHRWLRSGVRLVIAAVVTLATAGGLAPRGALAAADPINVTVTIQRFVEIDDPDGGIFNADHGNYYGIVDIGATGNYIDSRATYPVQGHTPDISPYWRFTRSVDRNLGTVPIAIQVKDDDTGVPGTTDDVMDINPVSGLRELHLTFNLRTGDWTGENSPAANNGFSQGDGDSERGKILFDVGFGNDDLAGDGIPTGVKHGGVFDTSGNLVADMAALGADPCRKTVALHVDHMQGQSLSKDATDIAVNAYGAAPVAAVANCPYPGFPAKAGGVKLIVDQRNEVPPVSKIDIGDATFSADRDKALGDRRPYFHYMLVGNDQTTNSGSSGSSDGRDLIMTLGTWNPAGGTAKDQGGTLMHELGHDLGLGHGGGDSINCKPNYLSVMNYDFQVTGIPSATPGGQARFDYSWSVLPTFNGGVLDEGTSTSPTLDEQKGLGGDGRDLTMWTPDNGGTVSTGATSGPLDWNGGGIDSKLVSADLNAIGNIVGCGIDSKNNPTPSPGEQLRGYDDWSNLKYGQLGHVGVAGSFSHTSPHPTYQQALVLKRFWAATFITSAGGAALSAVEGAAIAGAAVATFNVSDPGVTAADYTATIDWGDGSTSPGTVSGAGPFTVTGSHTYAEEGSFPVTVTIGDRGTASTKTTSTATVADAALTAQGSSFTATEGAAVVAGPVATFTDADPNGVASDYTATIDWGDGTTTTGTVSGSGTFTVSGDHTYLEEGTYTIGVKVADAGSATSANPPATVADAALAAQGTPLSATEGAAVTAGTVATFTDADPNGTPSDYTTTIDWGDGTTSAGTVGGTGPFSVLGDHTYAEEGTYTVTVSVTDAGGSAATASATATVADAALTAAGRTFTSSNPVNGKLLATFTDADPTNTAADSNQDPADYTATVDWGDGSTPAPGTVKPNGHGFDITGSHSYPTDGSNFTYTIKVRVCDVGGSCADSTSTIKLLYMTGRAYGAGGSTTVLPPLIGLRLAPTPDTGQVATTAARSTSTPCAATITGLVGGGALCANVTTTVDPSTDTGTSTATATVTNATIITGLVGVPTIVVTGVQATSTTTCSGSTGSTSITSLSIGGRATPVTPGANTTIQLAGGGRLVLNEQVPIPGGLTVNGVHLIVPNGLLGGADVVTASATSDIHNCPPAAAPAAPAVRAGGQLIS